MSIKKILGLAAVVGSMALVLPARAAEQEAAGKTTFTVVTTPLQQKYAPWHVLAVWVVDDQGRFVKTLEKRAAKQSRYLREWRKASKGNVTDAVTGATLHKPGKRTVVWDGTDANGRPVPDGVYGLRVEMTSANAAGPLTPPGHLTFTKGRKPFAKTYPDVGPFRGLRVEYTPQGVQIVIPD